MHYSVELAKENEKTGDVKKDEVVARRDARRKKILENAKSRLEKLNGKKDTGEAINNCSEMHELYPDPEIERFDMNPTTPALDYIGSPPLNPSISEQETKFDKFLTTRLHIVVITIASYCLLIIGLETFNMYSVFVPILVWEILEIILLTKENQSSSITLLMMMMGIELSRASVYLKIFRTLHQILRDMGLFLFSFALTHLLYVWMMHVGST